MPTTFDGVILDQGGAVLNVKSSAYGAVGNGSHDDAPNINAALAALPATVGVVYFPPGIYAVASTLVVPVGKVIALRGAARQVSVIRATGSSSNIISLTQSHLRAEWGSFIEDLTFDANNIAGTPITLTSCTLFSMRRVYIQNAINGSGLVLVSMFDSHFDDVLIEGCGNTTSPSVSCSSLSTAGGDSINNCIFHDLHIETDTTTTLLSINGTANNPADTLQFYGLKVHGNQATGGPSQSLVKLGQYAIGCQFFGGIVALGSATTQIECDGSRNKFIGMDHGVADGATGKGTPSYAYQFTANAASNHIITPNFKNGISSTLYKIAYMRTDASSVKNKLVFPQVSSGSSFSISKMISEGGAGNTFIGDDINDAGGLYLRASQGFSPLIVNGLSQTQVRAVNLRGQVTISGSSPTGSAGFTNGNEVDTAYYVVLTPTSFAGVPATGSNRVKSIAKFVDHFVVTVEAAPGSNMSITFDYVIMR